MGTNFFWLVKQTNVATNACEIYKCEDPGIHIGKRSAAGYYCWDCNNSLAKQASEVPDSESHYTCPYCGSKSIKEDLGNSAVGIELGFAKPVIERKKGVASCSSFSWAQAKTKIISIIACTPIDSETIVDEYARCYTGRDFLVMVEANCPIQYFDLVGTEFS